MHDNYDMFVKDMIYDIHENYDIFAKDMIYVWERYVWERYVIHNNYDMLDNVGNYLIIHIMTAEGRCASENDNFGFKYF